MVIGEELRVLLEQLTRFRILHMGLETGEAESQHTRRHDVRAVDHQRERIAACLRDAAIQGRGR